MEINNKKAIEDHIKAKIKNSGYPLEITISNIVEKAEGFTIDNTAYFFDEELQSGRSIDIELMSMSTFMPEISPLFLRATVPIECKKSESHAWIFYERRRLPVNCIYMDGQLHSTVAEPMTEPKFSYFLAEKLKLHYKNFDNQAVAYDEIKLLKKDNKERGDSDRKLIFEAINQLIKYICYDTHNTLTRISEKAQQKIGEEAIYLMFPTLIFDGLLYRASFDSGQLEIKEANHLLLNSNYRCPYCKRVESYTIDIVHSSYFPEYLKLIKTDISNSMAVLEAEKTGIIQFASNQRIELSKLQSGRISFLK